MVPLPRTPRLEEFHKMAGTPVRPARDCTQVEGSVDLSSAWLRVDALLLEAQPVA